MILMGIGGIMLLGVLHLHFLIPLLIAGFLLTKGWRMIKGHRDEEFMDTISAHPFHSPGGYPSPMQNQRDFDALDEWEKQMKNRK
jgi:hypothetical protein